MTFKVCINKGEWYQIQEWVLKYERIETGGDLFGLWLDGQTAVVQFVLGPGIESRRATTSFFQDVNYLHKAGTYLTKHHGLCNVGQWHSHHRINLAKPSVGDENTVWNNMPNLGLDKYIVFIANITNTNTVTVNCFLFQIENGQKLSVQRGKFEVLGGNSPLRMNVNVLKNVYSGAETFNDIPIYEKEISSICNEDVKDNLNINNENKRSTTTSVQQENIKHTQESTIFKTEKQNQDKSNNKLQESVCQNSTAKEETLLPKVGSHVASPRNQQEKQNNSYNPYHTACTSTHAKPPIRHERGLSQRVYTCHKDIETGRTTHCRQKLVKVKSFNTAVKTEIDTKRDMVPSFQNHFHQGNTNFSGVGKAPTIQTSNETGKEFQNDMNQTNSNASSIANNCVNSNNELISRATEMTKTKNVHPSKSPLRDRKGSPDHQINANQISHEMTEVKCTGQIGTTVKYLGGQAITKQPRVSRNSTYDNVESTEIRPTPMDTDEVEPISDTETRPNTPSGTFQGTTTSSPNDNEINENDELGWLCQRFAKMTLC